MEPCECPNENFICHAVKGCICRHSFTGSNCDVHLSQHGEPPPGSNGPLAAGIVISLILMAIIVALLFYFRRRVANLKTEIAHVQYIADPKSAPDRHHFDNPVYSYQTPKSAEDGATLLLNNAHQIKNQFVVPKNKSNLEKQKFGYSDEDVSGSCTGAFGLTYEHPASLKNRDADSRNPNINVYHSIDDLPDGRKLEHVYDEIKHKEGQVELDYDHLDYSRPGSSWKPHYQQMANGLGPQDDKPKPSD